MFVLKLTDKLNNSWGYCYRGKIECDNEIKFFTNDQIFNSIIECDSYIQKLLQSGWYRPDITEDCFEIVRVKQYSELPQSNYYTEYQYTKVKKNAI